jgi:anti-sigma regulatory factor (Ser/Thr protein kinase)
MEVSHESHAGHVRRAVQEAAHRLGASDSRAGEAAIVATEMATNLVKHGHGGEFLLREVVQENDHCALEMHALDKGPGMANVSACLRDGYSTAGSAGTGLGAIQRMAGQFQIHSAPGQGTALWAQFRLGTGPPLGPAARRAFESGGVSVALKGEELCGDAWDFETTEDGGMRVMVADGLGHGPFAEEAAREAVVVFQQQGGKRGPADCLTLMHAALFKTRGAAVSTVTAQSGPLRLTAAGVGNVVMRLLGGETQRSLTADSGTLGAGLRRVNETTLPWHPEALLILHSDGISSRWNLQKNPGLIRRHPSLVAGVIYRDFRHQHDDATVVAVRYHPLS